MFGFLKKLNFRLPTSYGNDGGFVALDIGSSSIKMVETAVEKSGSRLLHVGIAPLAPSVIQNNMVVDEAAVVHAIKNLFQEHGVRARNVISSVPGRAVIMKRVQMPKQSDEQEIDSNIEFEAAKVIPENLENVNLDYQVLNFNDRGELEVLLVAVKKELVNSYADVITEAGLTPAVMDVDYFAMENMYEANYAAEAGGGIVGLIHIGARYTSINLLQNGLSTFTGDLPMGGGEFTESLRQAFHLSNERAETFKLTGLLEGKQGLDLEAALRPTAENLVEEIRRAVVLYGAVPSEDGDGLKTIYLSGGSANLPGLRTLMEERMGVPARIAEPFRGFAVGRNVDRDYLLASAPIFAVGAGLSIRRPGDK